MKTTTHFPYGSGLLQMQTLKGSCVFIQQRKSGCHKSDGQNPQQKEGSCAVRHLNMQKPDTVGFAIKRMTLA